MNNQIILIGRLTKNPMLNGNKVIITLAVPRIFKNSNGEYENDFIPCTLFGDIASNTIKHLCKGDLIGMKGRIQSSEGRIELIAEKISFLSNSKKDNEKDTQ